ncbi:hypothetical protein LLH00_09680 [bacterium]|nr:hypothetical protein [bacterium]
MKEKDKEIIKGSTLVAVDVIVSSVPFLGTAWGLAKVLIGSGMQLRHQRALEWVEMIRDNPAVFSEQILQDQQFQDGFVFALEKYIRERNAGKRERMKQVFSGFCKAENKNDFQLEKFFQVLALLNEKDISVLAKVDLNSDDFCQIASGTGDENESVYSLMSANIFAMDTNARWGPTKEPFVRITEFGKEFIRALTQIE